MTDLDIYAPCSVCGQPATEKHHIEPRGRRPDLRDSKENLAPTCHTCNFDWLIPKGPWRVDRVGDMWVTTEEENGAEVCRRPVGGESKALALVEQTRNILDVRNPGKPVLALLRTVSDRDLLLVHEWGTRIGEDIVTTVALAHHEAYEREPRKQGSDWITKLAKGFGIAESTLYEHVRAGQMWVEDDTGPPMPWSVYAICCHENDPKAALATAREIWLERGSKMTMEKLRLALGQESEQLDRHECPECGAVHKVKT